MKPNFMDRLRAAANDTCDDEMHLLLDTSATLITLLTDETQEAHRVFAELALLRVTNKDLVRRLDSQANQYQTAQDALAMLRTKLSIANNHIRTIDPRWKDR